MTDLIEKIAFTDINKNTARKGKNGPLQKQLRILKNLF